MKNPWSSLLLAILLCGSLLGPTPAAADDDGLASQGVDQRIPLSLAVGGIFALQFMDAQFRTIVQSNRHEDLDRLADISRPFGEPYVLVGSALLMSSAALLADNDRMLRGSGRLSVALALSAILVRGSKFAAGRARPSKGYGHSAFEPFSEQTSWPSGHTTMAFTLAGALSREMDSRLASTLLYSGATLTAWSRLNDDVHWTSDLLFGAALAHLSLNWVYSQFGERPSEPAFMPVAVPGGIGISLKH